LNAQVLVLLLLVVDIRHRTNCELAVDQRKKRNSRLLWTLGKRRIQQLGCTALGALGCSSFRLVKVQQYTSLFFL